MKSVLKRFGLLNLAVVLIILLSNTVYDSRIPKYVYDHIHWDGEPFRPEFDRDKWNITFDQHSHTIHSDGVLTPEQNIQWHLAMGFNAMVISDHNTFDGLDDTMALVKEKYADSILVIPGIEWTTNRAHMNFLFPPTVTEKELNDHIKTPGVNPSDDEIRKAIEAAHALNGIVTINHIPWTERTHPGKQPSREEFYQWGIDYIEILNDHEWDETSYDFAQERNISVITGSDMHTPGTVYGWTLMKAEAFTAEALFKEITSGRTEILRMPEGVPYDHDHQSVQNPTFTLFRPLLEIGGYFTAITWPQVKIGEIFILLGWIWLVWALCEGIRFVNLLIKRARKA